MNVMETNDALLSRLISVGEVGPARARVAEPARVPEEVDNEADFGNQ
jgi:hypothetical protein